MSEPSGHRAGAPGDAPPPEVDYRRPIGVALLGVGVPIAVAGGLVFRLLFIPGRSGHAVIPLDFGHPAAKLSGALLLVGLLLVVAGLWLTRRPDRRSDVAPPDHPLAFSDGPDLADRKTPGSPPSRG